MIWLRSLAFNVWFWGVTAALLLGSIPTHLLGPRPARRWAAGYAAAWSRLVLAGLRVLCGIRFEVTGRENLPPSGPMLIASQHQSAFDTIVWLSLLPGAAYVMKRELMRIPLFGGMCRHTDMIVVDRTAGGAAIRELLRGADRAAAAARPIVIFPEGTRSPPGAPIRLQPGIAAMATRIGLAVIPVATDSGAFWGRRAFRKLPGTIHIAIMPPLPAGLPRNELMAQLQHAIEQGSAKLEEAGDNSVHATASGLIVNEKLDAQHAVKHT